MAFTAIGNTLIQVGKPIIKTLWDLTQGNFNDHETRVAGLEQGASKVEVFNSMVQVRGAASTLTGLALFRADRNFTMLDAKVGIFDMNGVASGTLEFDLLKSPDRDITNGVSLFTTKPSINYATASDYDDSTNAVFDNTEDDIVTGEMIFLSITSIPVGVGRFQIIVTGEIN